MNLAQLQNEFPAQSLSSLTAAIQRAVNLSVKRHPMRQATSEREIKDRVRWCCEIAVMLRRRMIWSSERICDTLPVALDTYLREGGWEPSAERIWST